jgi:tetratricopeptide (TPR) repeat protein
MSLLLEALKKAEKAKEEAQRRARSEGGEPELKLEAEAPASAPETAPVRTRDQLPEITSQPLEIMADEPPSAPKPSPAPPRQKPEAPKAEPAAAAAGRAAARKVFEAKFREPNPRLPFYITMGLLGAFALGTVVYFWMQLRPPPPLVNTNPVRPAGEAPVEVAAPPKPQAPAPLAQAAPIPGLPASSSVQEPARASVPEPARTPAPPPAELRPKPPVARPAAPVETPRLAAPEPRPAPVQPQPAARPVAQVHAKVESGYAAYVAGDLATARGEYEQALREEPANRDAQLGLAALDVKAGRYEAAEGAYLRLLQGNPRDVEAQAALIALRGGRLDPLVAESRVKSLLAAEPRAHVLNFTLGNQLAQQGRWAEAQQEYFKAFSAEPDNADFAYNLAVSLDHLRQPRLALEYYRRAVALAKTRGASFDAAAAQARIAQLDK